MPKLKDQQDADRQFDPYSNPSARDLYRQEQATGKDAGVNAGIDQAESFANDPANASRNIDKAREQEETGNEYKYRASAKSNETGSGKFDLKGNFKKKGPIGLLIGILFGGVGGLGLLISPSMAIVQMKEILTDDLNDQASAMDIRTTHVFRAKLKDLGKSASVCTGMVQVRCGLKGMSDRQIKSFERAGITVEKGEKNSLTRKTAVKSLTFTTNTGEKVKISNARDVNRMLIDRNIRSQIRRAYNPLFYGMWDKTAGKVFSRYGHTKSNHITGSSDEERDKAVNQSVAGEQADIDAESGKKAASDDDPNTTGDNDNDQYNKEIDRLKETIDGSSGFKSVFGGAVKGVGVIGTVDTACTVYNTSRMVEAGAKILRARQLVGFALVFLNFADRVKAGDATPEEAEYIGNKLTAIDTEAKVLNETSSNGQKVDNPYYNKSAFDSEGLRTAYYNDAPNLTARAQQFMVGGAMVGTLAGINDKVSSLLGGRSGARQKCNVVQNPFVRAGSFIVGGLLAIGSFGTSTAVSIAGSVALSFAIPILASYLKDMVSGEVVNADTEGVDAGNAIFSGTGVLLGDMAKARGMQPASEGQIQEYQAATHNTKQDMIATQIEMAKDEPFDIMNQYSFLGSFTRKLLPLHNFSSTSVTSFTLGVPGLFSSLIPSANAVGEYNGDRFKKCNDGGYEEVGIDADIFCNVRYVMTPQELNMDTDAVYQYMTQNNYVDDATGEAEDGDYKKFLDECVNRDWGWGEGSEEESSDYGTNCIDGRSDFSETQLRNFRVYTMDRSIEDGMDNGPQQTTENSEEGNTTGGSSFRIASFNVLGTSHTDGPGANKPSWPSWSVRIEKSLNVIQSKELDIIGFQEFEPSQRNYLKQKLPNYGMSSKGKESDSIMWNGDKFELVSEGTWQTTYFGGKIQEPWVKLRDVSTQQEFHVMNVHDPINRGQGDAQTRYENAKAHLQKVNELKAEAPVLLTGDFNSAYSNDAGAGAATNEQLTYCVLTKGGMNDAYDLSVPRQAKCPNKPKNMKNFIDHIYLTSELDVSSFDYVESGANSNGADHPTIFADVTIPSGDDATLDLPSKDGWVWPVPGVKQMGTLPYGASGSKGVHKGIDIGISGGGALGKPVVAAHDGEVVYVGGEGSACGAYVVIKATGTSYYAGYQHVSGIKVSKGDSVRAGTPIAEIGRQGGSTCGSSGFYHLHFSIESIFSPSHPVSTYADPHPHGTIDPLSVLPR